MLNGLDLFSGIGGISLALSPWVRTVCYVEIDRYCQAVLQSRIGSGHLETAPIWDDITTFDPKPWAAAVDIISAGFPCQDISAAGKGEGLEGKRSGLFFEIIRISSIIKPAFIFLENVPAILTRGGGTVISEIASIGYDTRWGILSAFDVGAPHLRERWWLLAHAASMGSQGGEDSKNRNELSGEGVFPKPSRIHPFNEGGLASNSTVQGLEGWGESKTTWESFPEPTSKSFAAWPAGIPEPTFPRGHDGLLHWVERTIGTGNSVVPATAREAFKRLMGIKA